MSFPTIPDDLTALSTAELAALEDELVQSFQEAAPEATTVEAAAELMKLADSVDRVRAEYRSRADAVPEMVAAMANRLGLPAPARKSLAAMGSRVPARARPRTSATPAAGVRITSGGGQSLSSWDDVVAEMAEATRTFQGGSGPERLLVASLRWDQPEVLTKEPKTTTARIEAAQQALVAAGGLCAPVAGYYEQLVIADATRPVRDSLVQFGADRGGVRFNPPPKLSQITQGVGVVTAAQDASGVTVTDGATTSGSTTVTSASAGFSSADIGRTISGAGIPAGATITAVTNATTVVISFPATATATGLSLTIGRGSKATFVVTCPAVQEVDVAAIYTSLQFGNFLGRSYPEQVEAWTRLGAALQARTAETALLDGIAANSTAVTSAGLVGGGREVLARVGQAAAGYRSRNRMAADAPLNVLLPAWVQSMIRADFARGFTDDPDLIGLSDVEIATWFAVRQLVPTWYLDSKTGGNQVFGAQAAGVLNQFPATAYIYVYAPGSFVFLDGGQLDLGLVRDSTLNASNNFRLFVESFENVAFVGLESLEVALTAYPDGTYGAAKTVTVPITT